MNNVFLKSVLSLGLLSTSTYAQELGKGGFEVRASGGLNASSGRFGSISPSYELDVAFGISRLLAVTAGYTHDFPGCVQG